MSHSFQRRYQHRERRVPLLILTGDQQATTKQHKLEVIATGSATTQRHISEQYQNNPHEKDRSDEMIVLRSFLNDIGSVTAGGSMYYLVKMVGVVNCALRN